MTPAKYASLIRFETGTDSTTLTDANILMLTNIFKDEICALLAKEVGEDYFGMRYQRDLVAGQREYQLPDEIMGRIKRVEGKIDGTNQVLLTETDLGFYGKSTDEATILSTYAGKKPQFDMWDRSIFILSGTAIVAVTNGLLLWAIIFPGDVTDLASTTDMSVDPTTTSHGIPRQLHELLARRVSIAYKSSKDRPLPLSEREQRYDADLALAIEEMKGANDSRDTAPKAPYNDGSNY